MIDPDSEPICAWCERLHPEATCPVRAAEETEKPERGAKPLVYVAGPISGDPFGCVRQSIEAFDFLRAIGAVPFCPQWSVLPAMVSERPYEAWMAYDFDVLAHCDALLRMPGESAGADREVDHALKVLGIPVVYWTTEGRAVFARALDRWDGRSRFSLWAAS